MSVTVIDVPSSIFTSDDKTLPLLESAQQSQPHATFSAAEDLSKKSKTYFALRDFFAPHERFCCSYFFLYNSSL